jgi:acetate---CoA ligase (ADP-forming)
MPEAMDIDRLLWPRSIVIVGASTRPERPGARILAGLSHLDFKGMIHLVNPSRTELGGRPCVPRIADIPDGVDLAALCVAKNAVQESLEECAARGVRAAVVFAAGYAEQDAAGTAEQERLAATARAAGIALLGPNCLGFASMRARAPITMVHVTAVTEGPGVAVVAQSGAIMSSLYATMTLKGTPVTHLVSVGNQAVLGIEDFETRVITVFAERLREPRRFLELAARARGKGKPIVLMHTGRSEKARDAARSHTGAMAGDHAVMRSLVGHEAVILVDSLDELADVSALAARYPVPPTKGVSIVTNSGAFRAISFDYCESVGLDVPVLERGTVEAMAARLPPYAVTENPMDLTVQTIAEPALIGIAARALLDDPNVGSAVLAVHAGGEAVEYARLAGPMLADSEKPVAYCLLGEGAPAPPELVAALKDSRIPMFRSVERGLGAIARLTAYGHALVRADDRVDGPPPGVGSAPMPARVGTWTEAEGKAWLAALGLPVPRGALARSLDDARRAGAAIGYPVVLKAQSTALTHKTDAGGVLLNLGDDASLAAGWHALHANVARAHPGLQLDGVLVERMARTGVELVIGLKRDPDWAPVLLVGLGGIWIEVIKDVRLMPADLSEEAIAEEIGRLRGSALLEGERGTPRADIRAVARIAATVGQAALANPRIAEIDLNPVFAYSEGEGALVLDALIVTDETTRQAAT